jgi:hypothetical protein
MLHEQPAQWRLHACGQQGLQPPTFLCCSDSQKGRKASTMAAASPARASSPSSHVSTQSMERAGEPSAGGSSPQCTPGPAYTEKQMTRPWQQGEWELQGGRQGEAGQESGERSAVGGGTGRAAGLPGAWQARAESTAATCGVCPNRLALTHTHTMTTTRPPT